MFIHSSRPSAEAVTLASPFYYQYQTEVRETENGSGVWEASSSRLYRPVATRPPSQLLDSSGFPIATYALDSHHQALGDDDEHHPQEQQQQRGRREAEVAEGGRGGGGYGAIQ